MKRKINLLLVVIFSFSFAQAKDDDYRTKLKQGLSSASSMLSTALGNYSREFVVGFSMAKVSSGNDVTFMQIGGSHLWEMAEQTQGGGELGFTSVSSNGNSYSYLDIVGVGAYNFNSSYANSPYAKAGLGIFGVPDKGDYEGKFGFFIGGGKRFYAWDHLSFSPEIRLYKKGDLDPEFYIQALNLSIMY